MSRNKNKPQGAKTNNAPKPPSANADVALLGSDTIPPTVELHEGKTVTLRDVVQRAHKESGLNAADWNKLTGVQRDEKLNAVINTMRLEQEPSRDETAATATENDQADTDAAAAAEKEKADKAKADKQAKDEAENQAKAAADSKAKTETQDNGKGFEVLDTVRAGGKRYLPGSTLPESAVTKKVATQLRKDGLIK